MANVTVTPVSVHEPEQIVVKAAAVTAAAADVLVLPSGVCLLVVVNSSGAATLTLSGVGGAADVPFAVAASKTVFIPIEDTTYYTQPDGTMHVTTSAALVDVYAIKR